MLLKSKAQGSRASYLWPVIEVAIETAMRRGEILGLEWENIDWINKRALLPLTKNGCPRWVPLSKKVIAILRQVPRSSNLIFPVSDVAFRQAWDRLRNKAQIKDLTFHDLRHEALSRKFEDGLSIPQVMSISGHKSASELFRYIQIYCYD